MNILTTEDARFIDREVPKQLGISLEILMENAGRGIVDALWGEYDLFSLNNGRSINSFVLFICGAGNNGADGLVVIFLQCKLSAAKLWDVSSICMMNSMIGPT